MTKEELKNKYSTFITKISEILGLGKPIDVLKLCATTDLFFQPLRKRIEELEKENAELKDVANKLFDEWCRGDDCCPHLKKQDEQLTKAKDIIRDLYSVIQSRIDYTDNIPLIDTMERARAFLR